MRRWFAPNGAVFEGIQTGDGRFIDPEALVWEDQPQPLRVSWEDWGAHGGAVMVGAVGSYSRGDGGVIAAEGWIDDREGTDGARVVESLEHDPPFPWGVSVDMDDMAVEILDASDNEADDVEVVLLAASFPSGRVAFDADGRARLQVDGAREALTAAGLLGVVAAAGDGLPEDAEILFTDAMDEFIVRVTRARLRGLTLVDIPAFNRATIELEAAEAAPALTAAVTGATDLPVAARDREWDGPAAQDRVFDLCTSDGEVDVSCVSRAFLWRDDDADPQTQGAYSLGFADVIGGELQIVPAGVAATAGGRGVDAADIPDEDKDAIRTRICTLYDRIRDEYDDWPDCPFNEDDDSNEDEAATAATNAYDLGVTFPDALRLQVHEPDHNPCNCGGTCTPCNLNAAATPAPMAPPNAWFTHPDFTREDTTTIEDPQSGRTLRGVPMHYENGQTWGHVAMWGQCHTGSPQGQCVLTPRSPTSYQWFHHGHIITAEGQRLPTGNLTAGGGHADPRLSYRAALNHYDDVSTLHAQVRAGEDEFGIWVAGAVLPDIWEDDLAMRKLRATSPSGDWRWINGALEMCHTHAVNGPGFPVPQAQVAAGGEILSLVAAGAREVAALNRQEQQQPAPEGWPMDQFAAVVRNTIREERRLERNAAAARDGLLATGRAKARARLRGDR